MRVTVTAFATACFLTLAPHIAFADLVTDWNQAALAAIRTSRATPPQASRALAILHVAMFDAINGITREYETYAVPSAVPASASPEAAASAAALTVLSTLFPGSASQFDALHASLTGTLPDKPQTRRGLAWGEQVARSILLLRAADNADGHLAPPVATAPDSWQATPPGFLPYLVPHWGTVTPFVLSSGSHVRPAGPPSLDSAEWASEFEEVKVFGASEGSIRTPEQTAVALFWADGAGTETPPGHWNQIAQRVVDDRPLSSLTATARLFAILNVALMDAGVAAWDAKYAFNFWRPVTAIHNGNADGNPETVADPSWRPLIVTPPFPEYVSGHSTFSAAAATILAAVLGTDDVRFRITSDGLPGEWREFDSFSQAASEAAMSRLYGGIHFRSAIEDGVAMGVEIASWTLEHFFSTATNRSRR